MQRKIFKYTAIGLASLLMIGFLALTLTVDYILKSGIERVGSEMTKTSVTVSGVSISPFSGRGEITGFKVSNPEGYNAEHAVEIGDFSISLDIGTLLSDEIVVHEIIIRNPSVYVEQKLPENNLKTLMDHIKEATVTGTSAEASMVIEHFLLESGTVELYTEVGGKRSAAVKLSKIELNDLGRGGGREAAEQVVEAIAARVVDEALQAVLKGGSQQLKKEAKDALEDIFN